MSDASAQSRVPPPPIPLTVLTGFLGAGKTSLLNRLLKDEALSNAAVIINEFGEIGLDHLLVEHVEDGVMLLSTGCLCCTMRGDLVNTLEKLLRGLDNGRMQFNRVIIETTGLADPAPVLHTAMVHPYFVMRFRLDGVVTVVDAVNGAATLDAHVEAVKQVAVADRIVLSKTDLVDTPERRAAAARLRERLGALNPAAPVIEAANAGVAQLIDCGLYDAERKIPDVKRWLSEEAYAHNERHHHHDVNRHDDKIRAFTLATDQAIPFSAFEMFLDLLRSMHGPNLLRVKGIVKLAESPDRPVVIHGVQHIFHPPATLAAWPDADRRTRLVFIVDGIEERAVKDLFKAFLGIAQVDTPDRAAITDNPLVPFGGADHAR
ncbi:MAG: GTP-binding protein [Alphaproteobacteria bacterium]|nr:MAG: GTP-binding protein [Alphaproteobacteria bacterium]